MLGYNFQLDTPNPHLGRKAIRYSKEGIPIGNDKAIFKLYMRIRDQGDRITQYRWHVKHWARSDGYFDDEDTSEFMEQGFNVTGGYIQISPSDVQKEHFPEDM